MTKLNISRDLAEVLNITVNKAATMVEAVLTEVKNGLTKDGTVIIRRFGTFEAVNKRARMGRNPKTGENAPISARRVATFTASKLLKQKVNK
tara:strand:+ start:433 stop:708 length:276 start_codon:yes stop_codon:yes gene_type:complete